MIKAQHTIIKDFKKLPNGNVIIYEKCRGYPSELANIYCLDKTANIKWYAELPFKNDSFINDIVWNSGYNKKANEWNNVYFPSENSFVAYTGEGIIASYSYETGKIIESELIK